DSPQLRTAGNAPSNCSLRRRQTGSRNHGSTGQNRNDTGRSCPDSVQTRPGKQGKVKGTASANDRALRTAARPGVQLQHRAGESSPGVFAAGSDQRKPRQRSDRVLPASRGNARGKYVSVVRSLRTSGIQVSADFSRHKGTPTLVGISDRRL